MSNLTNQLATDAANAAQAADSPFETIVRRKLGVAEDTDELLVVFDLDEEGGNGQTGQPEAIKDAKGQQIKRYAFVELPASVAIDYRDTLVRSNGEVWHVERVAARDSAMQTVFCKRVDAISSRMSRPRY